MKPTIGRIVHYHGPLGDGPFAAIVTDVHRENRVMLHVFGRLEAWNPMLPIAHSPEPKPGHWSWPPHEEDAITYSCPVCGKFHPSLDQADACCPGEPIPAPRVTSPARTMLL